MPSSQTPYSQTPSSQTQPRLTVFAPRAERPLPLWILYPLFFSIVYFSHWSLLRLPFFWDEAGYYIPAALDFFRTGALIPHSTVTNAHPPLPSILLSSWWHLSGFVVSETRTFICMVASAALLGVFRLARILAGTPIAAMVTALTAIYPVWFAQSTLVHADIFATAFTVWALSFYFERYSETSAAKTPNANSPLRLFAVAVLFSLAALSKETAIVTPLALGTWEIVLLFTQPQPQQKNSHPHLAEVAGIAWVATLFIPILPLALWYLFHYRHTGFVFGNPEFLRYNATANFGALRILVSLWHRFVHLTLHMGMFVASLATLVIFFLPPLPGRSTPVIRTPERIALAIVLTGNALAFSVLGGALLTRYLLPLYPLVLLLFVTLWHQRVKQWWWVGALTAAAFFFGLWINPPYPFAPEDNLTYRDMIVLHQQAVKVIETRFPQASVLTAWPATAELQYPFLGYLQHPIKIAAIDNFSLPQIQQAASEPAAYDTALVFSTKWVPPPGQLNLLRGRDATDTRLFDLHDDLRPAEIAHLLRGEIVWQGYRHGEWAAILRFPRITEAHQLRPPSPPVQ